MSWDSNGADQGRRHRRAGAHRLRRKQQTTLTRTVAVGGAAVCIGAAYELATPTADALSIVFRDGNGNATQVNIIEGNIFDPQLGIRGGTVSNNSTSGNLAIGNDIVTAATGNDIVTRLPGNELIDRLINLWSTEIVLGAAAGQGTGNTTQVNILSYNIINPQLSGSGGNVSTNLTVSNVAMDRGNYAIATSTGGTGSGWFGGMLGNGNTNQLSFFSGNIINPQFSLGNNVSQNTAVTNASIENGNDSDTQATTAGGLGSTALGTTGNGNTNQFAMFTSNVINPQFTIGGTNTSNNNAHTNAAIDNGNDSATDVTSTDRLGNSTVVGSTGNGNTNQSATGASNIFNQQWRLGTGSVTPVSSGTASSPTGPLTSRIKSAVDRALGGATTSDASGPAGDSTTHSAD